jgi:hydroxyacylglutathione hydrolase
MRAHNPSHSNTSIIPIKAFMDNYIWLINNSGKVAIVDPGDAKPVIDYLTSNALYPKAILITHKHSDHIGGVETIKAAYPEGDTLSIPDIGIKFDILETPGHTDDHIVYYNEESLFCGDTLFACGCGRLFEGTAEQMYESLQKLKKLDLKTKVYCAHEYTLENIRFAMSLDKNNPLLTRRFNEDKLKSNTLPSTIATELATNPFLLAENSEKFKEIRLKKDAF